MLPVTNGDSVIPQGIQPGDLAGLIGAIRHGDTYVNVHTATFPSGEIADRLGYVDDLPLDNVRQQGGFQTRIPPVIEGAVRGQPPRTAPIPLSNLTPAEFQNAIKSKEKDHEGYR